MEEAWERAVEAKLEGLASSSSSEIRVLNLDGAVKSLHGCLPPAFLLERFPGLEHLSIANVGAPSLDRFARLRNLQRLILSDNRIAGGLENLVDAGLESLRDLDLSNNRIQHIEDLAPLASLQLVSLDLYECPVTRVRDYRSRVFSMIRSLRYLDKLDANENERPESDDEDDDDDDEEEEEEEEEYDDDEEEEDSGNGEIDGVDQNGKMISNCDGNFVDGDEGIVDADEDDGSDADEEGVEINGRTVSNGFATVVEDEDGEDDDDDLGEEIDEDEAEFEVNVSDDDEFRVLNEDEWRHHVVDNEEEGDDGVDEEEIDEEDDVEEFTEDDDDDDEFRVEDEDVEPAILGRVDSAEGEIDGHEHGEEDENGEIGEEDEQGAEVRGAEDEDYGESEDEVVYQSTIFNCDM